MFIDVWQHSFEQHAAEDAIIWHDLAYSFGWLGQQVEARQAWLHAQSIVAGMVVVLQADYSPQALALLLALIARGCIVVPLTPVSANMRLFTIAQAEILIVVNAEDQVQMQRLGKTAVHPLYTKLRKTRHPGLIIFSSGSSGESKAIVHDMLPMLEKYRQPGKRLRTIAFMLFDHIGGVNTMLYTLANGGCLVLLAERTPVQVARAIEIHQVDLLPTSPTFLNLMLLSESYKKYDFATLKLITYGTEPMPESTLKRLHILFPHISLRQTYGLSEVGILRAHSRSCDSLWVKVGGERFQTRVVDGILQIKAESAMLGYLNAPSPFTADGWFITGDRVQVEGDYMRILGRDSEMINVGGEKVYPIEVESVIQEMEEVEEVTVFGEHNPITGQIVCAQVRLRHSESTDRRQFTAVLKRHCRQHLPSYKVPVKVFISDEAQHSVRLKKKRKVLL